MSEKQWVIQEMYEDWKSPPVRSRRWRRYPETYCLKNSPLHFNVFMKPRTLVRCMKIIYTMKDKTVGKLDKKWMFRYYNVITKTILPEELT